MEKVKNYKSSGNYQSSNTTNLAVVLNQMPGKSQFLHLIPLENQNLPTVCFPCFLDQFISTFSDRNHSVKFQKLKLSTKNLVTNYIAKYSTKSSCTGLTVRQVRALWFQLYDKFCTYLVVGDVSSRDRF